jgi:hypothetical protein
MHKLACAGYFCLVMFAYPSLAQDPNWNAILEAINNFAKAINNAGEDFNGGVDVAQKYLDFIAANWDTFDGQFAAMADFPIAIRMASDAIKTCAWIIGGSVVISSLICAAPRLFEKCIAKEDYEDI